MTQVITINYIPLIYGDTVHTRKLTVTFEYLFGIMIMAFVLSSPGRINIILENGDQADFTQIKNLPYIGTKSEEFEYTATFEELDVSFNSELLGGAIKLCILLGIDPSTVITNVKKQNIPVNIDFGKYFGILSVPNFVDNPDGVAIELELLKFIILPALLDSLSDQLNECFPDSEAGIIVPSELYMINTNKERSNVATSAAATLYLPPQLQQYNNLNAYYIFNVCSGTKFRGQGIAKSVMILLLNDLMSKKYKRFLLEVVPTNLAAYNLYESLGFKKIAITSDEINIYHLMYLSIP